MGGSYNNNLEVAIILLLTMGQQVIQIMDKQILVMGGMAALVSLKM